MIVIEYAPSLAEEVAGKIRDGIERGEIRVLPPAAELAKTHGVSSATVYTALGLLRSRGVTVPPRLRCQPAPPVAGVNGAPVAEHLEYLRLRGRTEQTIKGRAGALRRLAAGLGVPLLDAGDADLLAWRASLASLADVSVISAVGHVRGFYAWAEHTGRIAASPAAGLPVPPMPDYQPRPISEDDLRAAVAGAPARIRLWLVLAAWAGLRACEIAALRRSCVREHDDPPAIIIRKDATKGKRKGRTVCLCPYAISELLGSACLPASGWCFPRLDGQAGHVTAHLVSNLANEYLHDAGIADTLHSLRHRFATELLDVSGGDIRLVQDQLGHAHIAMTARYAKVKQARAAAAVALLPGNDGVMTPRQRPAGGTS